MQCSVRPGWSTGCLLAACVIACLSAGSPVRAQEGGKSVWQAPPAPAGAPIEPVRHVRVVDYGDDFIWHTGGGYFRGGYRGPPEGRGLIRDVDVDGDGTAEGDCIAYLTFSMDDPLNPPEPWWDSEGSNAVFYGGVTGFFPRNNNKSGFSELMANVHETPDGDNITMMVHGTREPHRVYGLWLWKKEDFLKGGDRRRVSLDDTSRIGLHVMRSWTAMDEARFVLRDADQLYISEYNFGDEEAQKLYRDSRGGKFFSVSPAETRWAEYDPKAPYHIVFESQKAEYRKRRFNDVQVAGYYIARHKWGTANVGAKMYAFELFGTVHRPKRPGETLDMVEIRGQVSGVRGREVETPPFYISKCEIPYALWHRVRRPAVAQMYGDEDYYPYITDRDGDMGSMDLLTSVASAEHGAHLEHGAGEPVTDITWLDAVAWCNMLSEYEGKEPCYYFTASFDTVFRRVKERRMRQRDGLYVPKVYVKWDADGYRLPTVAEWLHAHRGNAAPDTDSAWIGANAGGTTHPVGTRQPDARGLYDMSGNVWEFVWDAGESYREQEDVGYKGRHVVMGGGFHYPADPMTILASPYGDEPYTGNYNIGFRVVRSVGGGKPPLAADIPADVSGTPAVWAFKKGEKSEGREIERVSGPVLNMVDVPEGSYVRWDTARVFVSPFHIGKHEVTYWKWKEVYDWAIGRGYVFNKDGDMGSMDRETAAHVHGPQEPVTDINRFDAMIWCNALSEMKGRKPCYYGGNGTEVMREAHQYRRVWTHLPTKYKEPQFDPLDFDTMSRLDKLSNVGCTVDWSADGYRLPTMAEWIVACKAGTETRWYWGDDFDVEGKYIWSAENSTGKTHPVGLKEPNAFGLYDMIGNVYEYCWGQDAGGKGQQFHETWNPKGSAEWRGEKLHHVVRGGSFRYSSYWWQAFLPDGKGKTVRCFSPKSYPEIGFRPVRCEARTHRKSGSEMPEDIQVLDVNLKAPVTPLQGATHRGNLQRTGVHYTKPVWELAGLKWRFEAGGSIPAQPLVYEGTAYICSKDRFVYALDAETGREKWRYKTAGGPVDENRRRPAAPTIKDGIMYLGDARGYVYALDIRTGRPKWKRTVRGAKIACGSPVPVYGAVFLFIGAYTEEGGFLALHGETGQVLNIYRNDMWGAWQTWAFAEGRLIMTNHVGTSLLDLRSGARRSTPNTGPNHNIPVVQDGRVYTVGSRLTAVDYRAGSHVYCFPIEGKGNSEEALAAWSENTLALWNDALYFGNRLGYLYAHDAMTGNRLWKTKLAGRTRSAPSIATESAQAQEAVVYIGCADGTVWAVEATTGEELWSYKTGGIVRAAPWIDEGIVYIASDDGCLYALR